MSSVARTPATGGDLDPASLAWQTSLPVDRRLLEVELQARWYTSKAGLRRGTEA